MFAPPGVDSDSSGEEDDSPSPPLAPAPRPSLFKVLFTPTHKLNEQQAIKDAKKLAPVQAAEKPTVRPPTPPKGKKVRIHLAGEEHPDKVDLIASPVPQSSDSATSPIESMEEISTCALSPLGDGKRPEEVAGEVLTLLQKILAESAARPPSPPFPPTATLTPFPLPQGPSTNVLGLMGAQQGAADNVPTAQGGKKPSKLSKWTKIAMQVANPSSSNDSSPTSNGSTVPPYSSPVQVTDQQTQTMPTVEATQPPTNHYYHSAQTNPSAYPAQNAPSFAFPPTLQQALQSPEGYYQPPYAQSYHRPPSTSPNTAPAWPTGGPASQQYHQASHFDPAQQYPGHDGYGSPLGQGLAVDYYTGNVYASPPYPHHVAGGPGQPASAPPQHSTLGNGSKPDRLTDYPSRWRPGELHWDPNERAAGRPADPDQYAQSYTPGQPSADTGTRVSDRAVYDTPIHMRYRQDHSRAPPEHTRSEDMSRPPTLSAPLPPWPSAPPWTTWYPTHPPPRTYDPPPMAPAPQGDQARIYPRRPPSVAYATYHAAYPDQSVHWSAPAAHANATQQCRTTSPRSPPPPHDHSHSRALMHFPMPEQYIRRAYDPDSATTTGAHTQSGQVTASLASPSSAYSDSSASADTTPLSGPSTAVTRGTTSPVSSPRIVKQRSDGTFNPVEPYPEAQALLSPLTHARGPPPDYRSGDEAVSPGQISAAPRKVRKEDMSPDKQKEYDAVMRERDERKKKEAESQARAKAAEGSLSPKEVQVAVEKAAEARKEEVHKAAVSKSGPAEVHTSPTAKVTERQDSGDRSGNELQLQQERLLAKLKNGEISKEEAKARMKQFEKAAKAQTSPSTKEPTAPAEKVITPTGRGFAEVEKKLEETKYRMKRLKAKVIEGKMDKDEARVELEKLAERQKKLMLELPGPSSPVPEKPRGKPTRSRVEVEVDKPIARVKLDRTVEADVEGKGKGKEVSVNTSDPSRRKGSTEKANVSPKDPAVEVGIQVDMQAEPAEGDQQQMQLELNERTTRIKQKVAEGKLDKGKAREELARLEEKRMKLQQTVPAAHKTSDGQGDDKARSLPEASSVSPASQPGQDTVHKPTEIRLEAEAAAQTQKQVDELKARMKRIQEAVAEGNMPKNDGEEEMKRLQAKREKLKTMLASAPVPTVADKANRNTQAGSEDTTGTLIARDGDPIHPKTPLTDIESSDKTQAKVGESLTHTVDQAAQPDQTMVQGKMAELESRMKRIQAKVAEGKMDKTDGAAELKRLGERRKALYSTLKLQAAPETKKATSVGEERDQAADNCLQGAPLPGSEPTPLLNAGVAQERNRQVSTELANLRMQMQRIKVRVSDGRMSKDEGKSEMERLREKERKLELAGSDERPDLSKVAGRGPDVGGQLDRSTGKHGLDAKLAELRAKMQRVKSKVIEGSISDEDGRRELVKLKEREKEFAALRDGVLPEGAGVQADPPPAESEPIGGSGGAEQNLAEVRLRMQRIKAKVSDGRMDEDEGKAEMKRLRLEERNCEAALGHPRQDHEQKTSGTPTIPPEESGATDAEAQQRLAEVRARMQRVKVKVAEGKMSKEDAKAEISKLKRREEALEVAGAQGNLKGSSWAKQVIQAGSVEHAAPEKQTGSSTSEKRAMTLPDIDSQIETIRRKVKDGSLNVEKAKIKLEELTKLRQRAGESRSSTRQHDDSRQLPTAEVAQMQVALEEQMAKTKRSMRDGEMSPDEGKAILMKLAGKLKNLRDASNQTVESLVSPGASNPTATAADVPDATNRDLEDKLEHNKRKIVHLQKKVVSAAEADRAPLEKALRNLETERKELKTALPSAKTASQAPGLHQAPLQRDAPATSEGGEAESPQPSEVLDPDILREVLAFDVLGVAPQSPSPQSRHAFRQETEAVNDPAPVQVSNGKNIDADQSRSTHVPGSYPRVDETTQQILELPREPQSLVVTPTPQVAFPVARPADAPDEGHSPGPQNESHAPPISLPPSARSSAVEAPIGNLSNSQDTSGEQPPKSATVRPRSLDLTEANWSTCLVSVAECINLANHLLSQLATKHAMMASRGEDATSMVEQLIPRLLTAVLLQQDLHAVLQRIFGDESSRAIGDLMRHLDQVKAYLTGLDLKTLLSGDRDQSETAHGILAVTDRILSLSQYLSPDMMASLRHLVHEWKEEGLTFHKALRIIQFVKKDLKTPASHVQPAGEAIRAQTKASLLQQLLDLLDTDAPAIDSNATGESQRKQERRSLTAPPPDAPGLDYHSPPQSPRGVRKRLNSLVRTLRTPSSPPDRSRATASLQINHGPSRTKAETDHRHSSTDGRDVAPREGLTILTESLSSSSKRRVAEHRLNPSQDAQEEGNPLLGPPHLHLPSATADFLEAPLRSTTPAMPPGPPRHRMDPDNDSIDRSSISGLSDDSSCVDPPHRPRAWSSDSAYSVQSADSAGTVESDEEAREMLARADSGPQPVSHADDSPSPIPSEPDADELRRAERS